jgi:hypothetical protein
MPEMACNVIEKYGRRNFKPKLRVPATIAVVMRRLPVSIFVPSTSVFMEFVEVVNF